MSWTRPSASLRANTRSRNSRPFTSSENTIRQTRGRDHFMTNIKEIAIQEVAEIVCSAGGWRARGRSGSGVWLDVESGDLIADPLWEPSQKSRVIPLVDPLGWEGWAALLA